MDAIVHLCGRGCGCTSNQHTFERFVRVTRLYLLGRRFQPIQYKEMDSISRGLKPQAFGLMNNGILAKLFHIAMEPGSHVSWRMRRSDAPQQSNFDFSVVPLHHIEQEPTAEFAFESFLEDVEFKRLAGARISIIRKQWATPEGSRKVCVIAMAAVAYETTNTWITANRPSSSPGKLCDLAWPQASPRTAVHNFYSGMLDSVTPSRAALLIYRHAGCSAFATLAAVFPDLATWYRIVIVTADAVFWFRLRKHDVWPTPIAAAIDARRPRSVRFAAMRDFLVADDLDVLFLQRLRADLAT